MRRFFQKAGTCECLEGFDGMKCDKCAAGYYNFPDCEKCECDPRGTELTESCEKHCVCKVISLSFFNFFFVRIE